LNSGEAEVANLQVAVLVDQDVAGFQVSVDDAGGMNVFQAALGTCQLRLGCYMGCCFAGTHHDLVEKVLDELLLQRPRCE
jgi:hypothetical protein